MSLLQCHKLVLYRGPKCHIIWLLNLRMPQKTRVPPRDNDEKSILNIHLIYWLVLRQDITEPFKIFYELLQLGSMIPQKRLR